MKEKYWILGVIILIIFLLLLCINSTKEGFSCPSGTYLANDGSVCVDCRTVKGTIFSSHYGTNGGCAPIPITINSPLRIDNTCSDPNQTAVYDRFAGAVYADMTKTLNNVANGGTPCSYENTLNSNIQYDLLPNPYMGISNINLCLPKCTTFKGYIQSPNDFTLCLGSTCHNTPDLSNNILDSWYQVCGPLTKTELMYTSTLNSISSITSTMNAATFMATSNINVLSNKIYSSSKNTNVRDIFYPPILSNQTSLYNLTASIDSNYNLLQTDKNMFDSNYYSLLCDRYIS